MLLLLFSSFEEHKHTLIEIQKPLDALAPGAALESEVLFKEVALLGYTFLVFFDLDRETPSQRVYPPLLDALTLRVSLEFLKLADRAVLLGYACLYYGRKQPAYRD